MFAFIETPEHGRKKGDSSSNRQPIWVLLFIGCLLIDIVSFSFIPMGGNVSFDVSLLFLILVILPLLFLSLYLASKFGYGVIFAGFLSIPGAVVSVLVLGDFFGLVSGRNIVEDISVRSAIYYPTTKILTFDNPILWKEKTIKFTKAEELGIRAGGSSRVPVRYYAVIPIIDSDYKENESIASFAVCQLTHFTDETCEYSSEYQGGFQIPEHLRLFFIQSIHSKLSEINISSRRSPIFLFLSTNPRQKLFKAGLYGLGFILFLNIFWIASVFFYEYFLKKK